MTDSDKVQELTNGSFDEFVKDGKTLIDFYADWCMPCVTMMPVVEELSEKFKGKIKFGRVSVDDNPEIAKKFEVNAMPTFVLFENGEPAKTFMGAMSVEEFEERLNKALKGPGGI